VLLAWSVAPARAGDPPPSLAGSWVLNLEKSQGPRQQTRGYGSGGGDPGGEFGGGFNRSAPGVLERGLGELLRAKQRLTIAQNDSLLTVTDDAGWIRELIPNGQLMREELGQGGPANVLTRWKGNKLVAERRLDRGGVYRETYSIDTKKGQLTVQTSFTIQGLSRAMETKRVYDLSP
jgi:hypothetical protein